MARFPQLERLARYNEEAFEDPIRGIEGAGAKRKNKRLRDQIPIDQLPIDEVFRRINAGEYLE